MSPADTSLHAPGEPCVLVVFGATGDLARRKLLPGLYRLHRHGLLPERFAVVGSGRHAPGSDDDFRALAANALREHVGDAFDDASFRDFAPRLAFRASSADGGDDLAAAVRERQAELGEGTRTLVHLSVPPAAMRPVTGMPGRTGIARGASVVVGKPFGEDEESARALNAAVHEAFAEDRVFRVDHFPGKEAVQNILATRFAGGLLEPLWYRDHIAYVQIDVPEEIGIEGRASFMNPPAPSAT
ncbi:hypothetical protein GCM10023082_12060 [Streptomyces tremellae]|uniref:Glucose-6-phosphate dehydrogenase n=1 Tax=Streptomyces tremellae TaxID=1124239 RepID=A0ABP7EB95_9ACTN